MSEWISVKDRIPELGKDNLPSRDVLVLDDDGQMYVGYPTIYKWMIQETGCGCCSITPNIIKWMELPETPIKDKE